jgi:acyl-CoA thioester hydrolase
MFRHESQIRVRYGETDQMGYLYYGHYAMYFEAARGEAIRSLGITYKEQEEVIGVMMPIMSLNCRYVRPLRYDELCTVRCEVRELPTDFMRFHHEIITESGKLACGADVKIAFVNKHTGKRCLAPDYLLDKVKPFFE